jgi:excinuclease UvrABC ATPase subunit
VVATGTPEAVAQIPESITGHYLKNILSVESERIPISTTL